MKKFTDQVRWFASGFTAAIGNYAEQAKTIVNAIGAYANLLPRRSRSLRVLLTLGFGSVILMTLILGSVSFISERRSISAVDSLLTKDGRIAELSMRSAQAMLKARQADRDFLLALGDVDGEKARGRYVWLVQSNIIEVRDHLTGIRLLSADPGVAEKIDRIERSIKQYEQGFLALIDLYDKLGYADTGWEGQLNDQANEIEKLLGTFGHPELLIDLLLLRKHEKDFINHSEHRYVRQFLNGVKAFRTHLSNARPGTPANKRIGELFTEYGQTFLRYTEVASAVQVAKHEYVASANAIAPLLDDLHVAATTRSTEMGKRVQHATTVTIWTIFIAAAVATALGMIVAFIVSRRITGSATQLTVFAERVASGDFTARTNLEGEIEFAVLARALNQMTHALDKSHAALKDRAGELAQANDALQGEITERKLAEQKLIKLNEALEHHANYDALTSLANRHMLDDRLRQAIFHAQRYGQALGVVYVDLDKFKFINDSLGHSAGDEMLRTIADRLQACVRKSDTVARFGGDEFVLILQSLDSWRAVPTADARADVKTSADPNIIKLLHRMLQAVVKPVMLTGQEVTISCSMGISLYPQDGQDVETLLKNADAAMYSAKELGRNNFQFYSPKMNARAHTRIALQTELRHALDRGEFLLHYQPKRMLPGGKISGVEALIRWNHPTRGMVPPGEFIPTLEETGMIVEVGAWVMRHAATVYAEGIKAWADFPRIAVNVSEIQLRQNDFVAVVEQCVVGADGGKVGIDLEITESMIMNNIEANIPKLTALGKLDIGIHVDDFGTGYSSLSYLARLPITALKIDRSFIADLGKRPENATLVSMIISLAHNLRLRVVAEGVETEQQLRLLESFGCDEAQGYYLCKPIPLAELLKWLALEVNGTEQDLLNRA